VTQRESINILAEKSFLFFMFFVVNLSCYQSCTNWPFEQARVTNAMNFAKLITCSGVE